MNSITFENQIKQWIQIDNKIKELNQQIKYFRESKNTLEKNIFNYASSNNISNSMIKLNDGKLKFSDTRVPEPLTFKYLEKKLPEIIKNENQVKQIIEYVRQNREYKIIHELKRL